MGWNIRIGRHWLLLGTVFAAIAGLAAATAILVQVGRTVADVFTTGAGSACVPVGPNDPREYQKSTCEQQSGLANIDTVPGMLAHFGVTLPAGTGDLRFQVEDASTWNSGTQLILYLQFSLPKAEVARYLAADGAAPSGNFLIYGDVGEEMQLGPVWTDIALHEFGGRLRAYTWGDSSGGGALAVDDGSGAGDPTIYLTAGSESY